MFKSQAFADLTLLLSGVTTPARAGRAVARALRQTGLAEATTLDERDLQRLLVMLAAEGGPIEAMAIDAAVHGAGSPPAAAPIEPANAPTITDRPGL